MHTFRKYPNRVEIGHLEIHTWDQGHTNHDWVIVAEIYKEALWRGTFLPSRFSFSCSKRL